MISARRLSCFAATTLLLAVACTKNTNTPTPTPTTPSCTVTAGTISASSFPASGGTGSVPVTAGTGCTWTATSSATFVTISAGASGTGNGTVSFTVAANTGGARTATLTVAGTSFTITQSAVAPSTPGTLVAPTAQSPIGGVAVDTSRPTLTVTNATASGTVGTVTYRFEISDLSTFPDDPVRTFSADGIAQGTGTTSAVINRDLGPDVLWYWHARATDGTVTSAYSATETFRTRSACSFTVSPTTVSLGSAAATSTITVTAASTCAWTAVSGAAFISVTAGASGSGNGTVTISVDANTGAAARTGAVTVAGQTVTVTQAAGSSGAVVAAFQLLDPSTQPGPTDTCRIRSSTGVPTTCVLQSTSFPLGTTGLVSFSWTIQYTYVSIKVLTQTGSNPQFSFTDTCGQLGSTVDGVAQPLTVTLTVTDSAGNTATATTGTGNQPPLFLRLFTCGS